MSQTHCNAEGFKTDAPPEVRSQTAGFQVPRPHCNAEGIKTDAPPEVRSMLLTHDRKLLRQAATVNCVRRVPETHLQR